MQDIFIAKDQLLATAEEMLNRGCRLTNAVCLDEGKTFEVIYVFQQELDQTNIRIRVEKDEEVPSLSGLQLSAVLIENEMKEFFGINITGIALDFQCRMILAPKSPKRPMLKELPVVE